MRPSSIIAVAVSRSWTAMQARLPSTVRFRSNSNYLLPALIIGRNMPGSSHLDHLVDYVGARWDAQ